MTSKPTRISPTFCQVAGVAGTEADADRGEVGQPGISHRYRDAESAIIQKVKTFYREAMSPYFAADNKKPVWRQVSEMVESGIRYRHLPYQYMKHGCYQKGRHENYRYFIPPVILRRYQLHLNPPDRTSIVDDKVAFNRRLRASGIATVPIICQIDTGNGVLIRDGVWQSFEDWLGDLGSVDQGSLFIKPVDGLRGEGCFRLDDVGGRLRFANDGEPVAAETLRRVLGGTKSTISCSAFDSSARRVGSTPAV